MESSAITELSELAAVEKRERRQLGRTRIGFCRRSPFGSTNQPSFNVASSQGSNILQVSNSNGDITLVACPVSANSRASADAYSVSRAEILWRAIEASTQVRRRTQFFTWLQSHLQSFVPHRVALCGAYDRSARILLFDVYNVVPVAADLLPLLHDDRSPLIADIAMQWVEGGGNCIDVDAGRIARATGPELQAAMHDSGLDNLLVHGVARPHRQREIETLFIFASREAVPWRREQRLAFEMLLPHLHIIYLRARVLEGEASVVLPNRRGSPRSVPDERHATVTEREREILAWVREGKSNVEIGQVLGISGLTVKNHVQKILRKLGASNRAQAVARAIAIRLISSDHDERQAQS